MMLFTVVIPARFASTRLPGKPLQMIGDKPMIQRVYEQACKSDAQQVIVATDDQRIADVVKRFGGEVCMTLDTHTSGTDRIQEVAATYGIADEHVVVNVQGDEPLIPPEVINQVATNLYQQPQAAVATLSEPITTHDDFHNANVVKVVTNQQQLALYFSRAAIPFSRDNNGQYSMGNKFDDPQRHIGIYAYRVSLLHRLVTWSPAYLEVTESLEQLRVLAYGENIHVEPACKAVPGGIDTPEDLANINQHFQ